MTLTLEEKGGIQKEDIDGDGVIRMMRIKTPYGAWKIDPATECSMTLREPSDVDGDFYDIYPEGVLKHVMVMKISRRKKMSGDWILIETSHWGGFQILDSQVLVNIH